jgi:hypothetical protein
MLAEIGCSNQRLRPFGCSGERLPMREGFAAAVAPAWAVRLWRAWGSGSAPAPRAVNAPVSETQHAGLHAFELRLTHAPPTGAVAVDMGGQDRAGGAVDEDTTLGLRVQIQGQGHAAMSFPHRWNTAGSLAVAPLGFEHGLNVFSGHHPRPQRRLEVVTPSDACTQQRPDSCHGTLFRGSWRECISESSDRTELGLVLPFASEGVT